MDGFKRYCQIFIKGLAKRVNIVQFNFHRLWGECKNVIKQIHISLIKHINLSKASIQSVNKGHVFHTERTNRSQVSYTKDIVNFIDRLSVKVQLEERRDEMQLFKMNLVRDDKDQLTKCVIDFWKIFTKMFANPLSCAHVVARVAKVLVKHYALLREMSQPPVGKRLQYTLISEYLSGIRLSLQTVYRDVFQKDKIASNLWDNSSTVALKIKQLKKDTDRMILRLSATQEYNIARSPNESTCLVLVEISLKWQDDFSHFKQLIVDVLNNVIKRLESIKIRSLYVAVKLQTFWKMLNDEPSYYQLVHELFELLLYFNEQRLENREGARLKVEYLIENIPFDGAENILQRLLKIQGTLIKSLDPLQDKHCMSKLVGAIDSCKVYTVNTGSLLANTENEKKAERIDQSNRYQRAPQTRELSQESLSLDEQLIEVVDNIDELLNDQSGIFLQPNDMECLSYIKRECENELLRARLRAKYLTDQSILLITAITNREGMGF